MERKRISIALVSMIVFLLGCNDIDTPKPTVETPFFSVNATIDGQIVSLHAGVDQYYLFTIAEPDSFQVPVFKGILRKRGCSPCTESIEVYFRGDHVQNPSSNSITTIGDRVLHGPVAEVQPARYEVQFFSESTAGVSHFWSFGDGSTSTTPNPTHTYYESNGQYSFNVLHTVSLLGDTCSAAQSNVIELQSTCTPNFTTQSSGYTVYFNTVFQPGEQVVWNFGDGQAGYGSSTIHTFNAPGSYQVDMQVSNPSSGCYATLSKIVQVIDTSDCHANFHYQTDYMPSVPGDSLQLSSVGVKWTDDQGQVYQSSIKEQPEGMYFRMLETQSYLDNEMNRPTVEYRADVDLYLYNETGTDSVRFTSTDLHMAAPLPQ